MTPADRAEWRRLAEAATPYWSDTPSQAMWDAGMAARDAFAAHSSPDRVLALLGECERLREQAAAYWKMIPPLNRLALKGPDHE